MSQSNQSQKDDETLIEPGLNSENGNANILQCSQSNDDNPLKRLSGTVIVDKIDIEPDVIKKRKVDLFTEDTGPKWYNVTGNIVTPPLLPCKLPEAFNYLPVFGKAKSMAGLDDFFKSKVREFVGCDLNDAEFEKLSMVCSLDNLRTGKELVMTTNMPKWGLSKELDLKEPSVEGVQENDLCIVKKCKLRVDTDTANLNKLKYRGTRLILLPSEDISSDQLGIQDPLEPGKDILCRVRVYRPFLYSAKDKPNRSRHSVFSRDVVILGRQKLYELRDRIVCPNDVGMRFDVSDRPYDLPETNAKDVFPSGFMFINNVFYVDTRKRCLDHSKGLRQWASKRGLGDFPCKDMSSVRIDELVFKLGHPEVYMHQGNCEHLFTFSEVRLLNPSDPMHITQYPCHTAVSQNQTIYCTTCAEFGAKWIVSGCHRVPFNPAFFCETCFKLYLYDNTNKKIGNFKAHMYLGNEVHTLKTQA